MRTNLSEPIPSCRGCRHWDPKDDNGGQKFRTRKRRCRRFQDFFTVPHYLCRSYESKEEK